MANEGSGAGNGADGRRRRGRSRGRAFASLPAASAPRSGRKRGGIRVRRSWLRLFWAGVVVAAAVAGYLVSSGLGERVLHHEIERQLGRILEGPVRIGRVDLALSEGLQVEAHGEGIAGSNPPGTLLRAE